MCTEMRQILVSVAEQARLCLTWSQTPEDRFSGDMKLEEASDKEPYFWSHWIVAQEHLKNH